MAALLIVGALAIADKVEQKKEKKRAKKAADEKRYRELQLETNARLTRRESAGSGRNAVAPESAFVEEPAESSDEENANRGVVGDEVPPPAYEDAVEVQERREREWAAQMMRRRRSSARSERSGSGGSGKVGLMRMG